MKRMLLIAAACLALMASCNTQRPVPEPAITQAEMLNPSILIFE